MSTEHLQLGFIRVDDDADLRNKKERYKLQCSLSSKIDHVLKLLLLAPDPQNLSIGKIKAYSFTFYFELVFHIKYEVNVELFVGFLIFCLFACQKSVEHNCVGLFLDSPYCFTKLSVYSSTRLHFLY